MLNTIKKWLPKRVKDQIRKLNDKRKKFTCPICNHSFNELDWLGFDFPILIEKQVIGGGKRKGKCPHCGSGDRDRLLYLYLKKHYKVENKTSHLSLLHIAPENKITDYLLSLNLKSYICGDLFTEGYTYPDYVQNIDILDIPFDDQSFDLILCNHVLEHIQDDHKAMSELKRVLKKGGQAILQVPIAKNSARTYEDFSITNPKEREAAFGQFNHVRIYGQDYMERLQNAGFKVNRISISSKYRKAALNKDEDLFVCYA